MVTQRELARSGRPGELVSRLHQREPEPVTQVFAGVNGQSQTLPVNPWEGYVADIEVRIGTTDTGTRFDLVDEAGTVLDSVDVPLGGNGSLRFYYQHPDKLLNLAVVPAAGGAVYSFKLFVLRHRITGVV